MASLTPRHDGDLALVVELLEFIEYLRLELRGMPIPLSRRL